jgi:hypothetical protein
MDWFLNKKSVSSCLQLIDEFSTDDIIKGLHRQPDEALLFNWTPVSELIEALDKVKDKPKADEIMRQLPTFLLMRAQKFPLLNKQLKFLSQLLVKFYRLGDDANVGQHRQQALQFQFCLGIPKDISQFFLQIPPVKNKQTDAGSDSVRLTADIADSLYIIVEQQLKHPKFKEQPREQQEYLKKIYRETQLCHFATCDIAPRNSYSRNSSRDFTRFLDWITADRDNVNERAEMTRRLCNFWYTQPPVLDLSDCGVNQLPDDINLAKILYLQEHNNSNSLLPESKEIRSLFTSEPRQLAHQINLLGNPFENQPRWFDKVRPTCQIIWNRNPSGNPWLDPRFNTSYQKQQYNSQYPYP